MINSFENYCKKHYKDIVFVCVGNSDVWYDSFGPIVGSLLKHKINIPCFVYGDIDYNIKLNNLNNFIEWVKLKHFNKKIIVIDAALSDNNYNGLIFRFGQIKCAYFKNDSIPFGDYSVLCPIKKINNETFNFNNIILNALIFVEIIKNIFKM